MLRAILLVDIADVVLIRKLMPLADRDLEVSGLQDSTFAGGQAALLRRAGQDAALRS
jgi:hypothetical protein